MNEINFDRLKELMRTAVIDFSYRKVNGEIRNARGTLDTKYIDERGGTPNGTGGEPPTDILRYWDTNSDGWRSCKINNIISFTEPDAEQGKIEF